MNTKFYIFLNRKVSKLKGIPKKNIGNSAFPKLACNSVGILIGVFSTCPSLVFADTQTFWEAGL